MSDRSTSRTRRWTNTDEHRFAQDAPWAKELAEAEAANRADDSIPVGPEVKEMESLEVTEAAGQLLAMG